MLSDLRIAVRALTRNKAFSLTVVAVLALGIGANSAIFGLVDQALFAPAGLSDPSRLVALRASYAKLNLSSIPISGPDFRDAVATRDVFAHTAVEEGDDVVYAGSGHPLVLQAAKVSREWFDVFGAVPLMGRTFVPEEDEPNAQPTVVLSYSAWVRLLGRDPGVVGRTIVIDDKPTKVAGVMGAAFRWPRDVDVWVPMRLPAVELTDAYRFNEHLEAVARLRPGVSLGAANARVRSLADHVRGGTDDGAAFARSSAWTMFAMPFTDYEAGDTKRPMLGLLGAVGSVLLIACANIAGLMLARMASRSREIAVRSALGAGRWPLLRQALAESVVLSAAGATVGLGLVYVAMRVVLTIAPEDAVVGLQPVIDARVVAVTAGAAVLAALLFALVPGWQIARVSPVAHLQGSARTVSGGRSRQRIRASLVVVETALALMLLVGAGLLLRSLIGLEHVTPGFETRGLLMNGVALPERTYQTPEQRAGFIRALLERLRGAPGVTAVAAGTPVPFSGGDATASFEIEGTALGPGDPGPHGRVRTVTPGYFATLSIPLRQGRVFTDDDRLGSAPVAVIDENLARRYWPGQDPVGRRMRAGTNAPWMTIVGVVGRVLHSALAGETDKGTYYLCLYQQPTPSAWLLARLRPGAGPSPGIIGDAVASLDATLPVRRATSMEERLAASLAPQRFVVRVLAFFAGMALLLAALGLYGVISYSVAQRTQEIGVRMALGADRWSVLGLVLRQGVGLTLVGAAAGVVGAIGVARLVASQLFNVGPFDPVTFLGTVAVLLTTAVVATWLPARQASRVDPWRALRCE